MTNLLPVLNRFRPAIDHRLVGQFAPLFRTIRAFPPPLPALPKVPEHHPAQALVAPHVAVDRHVAQAHSDPPGQLAGDLLRTPLFLGQERLDLRVNLGCMVPCLPASAPAAVGVFLCLNGYVRRARLSVINLALRRTSRLSVLGLRSMSLAILRSDRLSRLSADKVYRSASVSWRYMRDLLFPE